jgi:DNA-binding transcriptional ArsR family regulator
VLADPRHHPLQHGWVRRARRLPASLRREVDRFRFAFAGDVPDIVLPAGFDDFETELARLRALDPRVVVLELLRPGWDHGGDRDPARLERDDLRAHARSLRLAIDDPERLRDRFVALLAAYWEAGFEREWERLEPLLAEAVTDAGREIAARGLYPMLAQTSTRLRVDETREEFGIDLPHHHRVEVTEASPLLLIPSAFVWPHVRVNCDEPYPPSVVYPAPFVRREARPRLPDAELLRLLRALGDDTRLRALRLIAEAPRSTQELAPLVGITEAGLSKHLRVLAEAGIVESRRDGYYVLYSLVPERLQPLSSSVLAFLGRNAAP